MQCLLQKIVDCVADAALPAAAENSLELRGKDDRRMRWSQSCTHVTHMHGGAIKLKLKIAINYIKAERSVRLTSKGSPAPPPPSSCGAHDENDDETNHMIV
jgi:hypothetical protein